MIHEIHFYDISFLINSSDTSLFISIVYDTKFFFLILRYSEVYLSNEIKYIDHLIRWSLKSIISHVKKSVKIWFSSIWIFFPSDLSTKFYFDSFLL